MNPETPNPVEGATVWENIPAALIPLPIVIAFEKPSATHFWLRGSQISTNQCDLADSPALAGVDILEAR